MVGGSGSTVRTHQPVFNLIIKRDGFQFNPRRDEAPRSPPPPWAASEASFRAIGRAQAGHNPLPGEADYRAGTSARSCPFRARLVRANWTSAVFASATPRSSACSHPGTRCEDDRADPRGPGRLSVSDHLQTLIASPWVLAIVFGVAGLDALVPFSPSET